MQPRHRGRHHRVAQRRFADQHVIGRAVAAAAIDAETGRGVALRIEIDDQHALADRGQRGAEIDRGGGLADAALLVGQRQNARMAGRNWRSILLINLINYGHARVPWCCCGGVAPLDPIEFDDPAVSAGAAGMEMRFDIPIFSGFGQFRLYILALEKQGFCTLFHQRLREADELM